jgi:hypothetical protein
MSSKTTFKRIALIAVAGLGLGVLSVAPSSAVQQMDSLTISSATAAQQTTETATASSAVATLSFLGSAGTDTMTVTASLVSGPAGNTALPVLAVSETTTASASVTGLVATVAPTGASTFASAKFKVYMNAPAVVGSYVVKLTPAVTGGTANAAPVTLTITVTAIPSADTVAATATAILNAGETVTATADATVAATKTASTTDAAATIKVSLLNAAGSAAVESYTATISGPGTIGAAATAATTAGGARIAVVKNTDVVGVFPDGNSGVATITISSAAGKVLATKTVTFYGAAASLTASTTTAGKLSKNYLGVGETSTVTIVSLDSAGAARASSGIATATPASTAIATAAVSGDVVTFTGVAAGTTNVVISDGTLSYTVPVTVTKSTAKTVTMTLAAATYGPGELATLTVTATDANGKPVADGARSLFGAAVVSNVALNNATLPGTSVNLVDGKATYTFYTPVGSGTLLLTSTEGSATDNVAAGGTAAKISATTTIANASADAANEATDAANAATDAALAAADAADAATAAAMDASDAVAALSATVAKLVASLKAQITSLTNLVIKIQKKVKA